MPYNPRSQEEIWSTLMARVIARTDITAIEEGSVIGQLLGAIASEIALVEERIRQVRDSFDLRNAKGLFLDERVSEISLGQIKRLGATAASGPVLTLLRDDTTTAATVSAGTVVGRSDRTDITYTIPNDVTFGIGIGQVSNVQVVCNTVGSEGNAPSGAINRVISGPTWLKVTQPVSLAGGQDRETDDQLLSRALAFLRGLTRGTASSLEYIGLTFESSTGIRFQNVVVYEDPNNPGYCELVVDDGYGSSGWIVSGSTTSGTVEAASQNIIWCAYPAASDPVVTVNGGALGNPVNKPYTVIHERGIIYLTNPLSNGDSWSVSVGSVYSGPIAELQSIIEGDPSNFAKSPGWRPAGGRVRVVAPDVEYISVKVALTIDNSINRLQIVEEAKNIIKEHIFRLGPGKPLYLSPITASLMEVPTVKDVTWLSPTTALVPSNKKTVIRVKDEDIAISAG